MRSISIILSFCFALAAMALLAPPVHAYPTYSAGKISHPGGSSRCDPADTEGCEEAFGNCKACHGHFRATNEDNRTPFLRDVYISNSDGQPWGEIYQEVEADAPEEEIGLHDVHRHIMLDKIGRSRCDVCHTRPPGFYPVHLDSSSTTDLEPISCMGCHGRFEDNANTSTGYGAGLRQHHTNAGVAECKTCHEDADPANYTPVGENVLPPYYSAPNDVFVNKPTNPCNSGGEEDYAGGWQGLDNDGDGVYDIFDRDCRPLARRIEVCHVWHRGPRAGQTRNITVSRWAVAAHLRHGDTLGACRESLTQN